MKDICDAIDNYVINQLPCPGFKFFGLAEIVIKGAQNFPVTINDRKQISIDNRFDGIVYHRVISPASIDEPDEFQWGTNAMKVYGVRLRTFMAHKVEKFAEEFVFDFINALPQYVTISGYKKVDVADNVSLISDQAAVYAQEFAGGKDESGYEKHATTYNIYAIEYDVNFIKC